MSAGNREEVLARVGATRAALVRERTRRRESPPWVIRTAASVKKHPLYWTTGAFCVALVLSTSLGRGKAKKLAKLPSQAESANPFLAAFRQAVFRQALALTQPVIVRLIRDRWNRPSE